MNEVSGNFEKIARLSVPFIVMFALFILNIVFVSTPQLISVDIPLIMMVIYYWSIYRPTLVPPILVFLAGVFFDALSGWPIGVSAFIFLLLRQSVSGQRLYLTGQPFIVIWLGFMGALTVALCLQWALFSLIFLHIAPILPSSLTLTASILMFPLVSFALHLSHKLLPDQQDQYGAVG